MKRIISILLVVLTLVLLPLEVCASAQSTVLPELQIQSTQPRTRKKVEGLRMYVDEENPLFMIRNCPMWGGPQTGETFAEYAIKTYNALPEDIRAVAGPVLAHRVTSGAGIKRKDAEARLMMLVDQIPVPLEDRT